MLKELEAELQKVSENVSIDVSSRKFLNSYNKVSEEIDEMNGRLKKREDQDFIIADANSAIFVPVALINEVIQENRESTFLKSTHISYMADD